MRISPAFKGEDAVPFHADLVQRLKQYFWIWFPSLKKMPHSAKKISKFMFNFFSVLNHIQLFLTVSHLPIYFLC
jgi:hypothetical protein